MRTELDIDDERPGLGLLLTAAQVATWFAFVACCAFGGGFIEGRLSPFGVPWAFMAGFAVIATGVLLTIVYVLTTNRPERAA